MKAVMSITVLYCSLALFKINNFIEILSCTTKCHSAPHKHLTFKHIKNNSNITELFERVKLVVVFMQNKKTLLVKEKKQQGIKEFQLMLCNFNTVH